MRFGAAQRKATRQKLYNDHLAAVRRRVADITATGDVGSARDPGALADAEALDACERLDDRHPEDASLLGWLYWYCAEALVGSEAGEYARRRALYHFSVSFLAGLDGVPDPLLPEVVDTIAVNALQLLHQVINNPEPEHVAHNTRLWQRLLTAAPRDHPALAAMWSNLGIAAGLRYEHTRLLDDLEVSVDAGRRAVELTAPGDPGYGERLRNLARALKLRFTHTRALLDLDALIDNQRALLRARPGDAGPGRPVEGLAIFLWERHELTGSDVDLDAAIEAAQRALEGIGPDQPRRAQWLCNVGSAYGRRYERHRGRVDLTRATLLLTEALEAAPADDTERSRAQTALAKLKQLTREGER
ncbi:hypothetical protein [Streptomyces sp. NPDC001401]|uniref:hypothetical protein n=1 Tax=Streptomyces sp. NPDC001401 TaxID=3364570 RepID=UPI0036965629